MPDDVEEINDSSPVVVVTDANKNRRVFKKSLLAWYWSKKNNKLRNNRLIRVRGCENRNIQSVQHFELREVKKLDQISNSDYCLFKKNRHFL